MTHLCNIFLRFHIYSSHMSRRQISWGRLCIPFFLAFLLVPNSCAGLLISNGRGTSSLSIQPNSFGYHLSTLVSFLDITKGFLFTYIMLKDVLYLNQNHLHQWFIHLLQFICFAYNFNRPHLLEYLDHGLPSADTSSSPSTLFDAPIQFFIFILKLFKKSGILQSLHVLLTLFYYNGIDPWLHFPNKKGFWYEHVFIPCFFTTLCIGITFIPSLELILMIDLAGSFVLFHSLYRNDKKYKHAAYTFIEKYLPLDKTS
jgi:hypothetical protein